MRNNKYDNRKYVFGALAVTIVLVYIVRLIYLQLIRTDYQESAAENAFVEKTVLPERGVIYDRTGNLLVTNQPSFDIIVVMREVSELDTALFCTSLDISREEFVTRMAEIKDRRKNPGYSSYTPQIFMNQLKVEEVSQFSEIVYLFKGFSIQSNTFRQYKYPAAAHLLGDMGEVSKNDIENDSYYVPGDFIGKQGVEKQYEKYLRGEKGKQILLRDAVGRVRGHYMDGAMDVEAHSGQSITLSIDINLQMLGERLMRGKRGSIVAIEPSTGEILCMVSSPSFDPSLLVGGHRSDYYRAFAQDESKPLLNRAIMGTYPPGSTFKTAQALTMLQEGIINDKTRYPCTNGFVFGNLRVGCHSHSSPISLLDAIATSCNGYFCWGFYHLIGSDKYTSPQQALTVWKDYMVEMGFGYALGVDLPGEKRGMIPNAQYYDNIYRKHWSGLTIISNAIGQGEITLTPLQIANLGASIANRGYFYTPHAVRQISDADIDSVYTTRHVIDIDREYYETVINGMRQAVESGTCIGAANPDFQVCGKTGTAENRGKDHSVFMGFAPMVNPQIAVSVYVENGGFGAAFGVPVGGLMMEQYINGGLSEKSMVRADEIERKVIAYGE